MAVLVVFAECVVFAVHVVSSSWTAVTVSVSRKPRPARAGKSGLATMWSRSPTTLAVEPTWISGESKWKAPLFTSARKSGSTPGPGASQIPLSVPSLPSGLLCVASPLKCPGLLLRGARVIDARDLVRAGIEAEVHVHDRLGVADPAHVARQAAALPGGLGIGRRVVGLEGPEERELVRDDEGLVADERPPVAGLGRRAAQQGAVGRHRREDAVERVAIAVGVLVALRSLAHAEGREGVARGQDRARRRGGRLEHGALRVGEAVGRGLDDLHHLVERVAVAVAVARGREGRERVAQRLDLLVGGDRRQAGATFRLLSGTTVSSRSASPSSITIGPLPSTCCAASASGS